MQKLGMQEGEAIEHPWVTKAIEKAQRKVEGRNFDIRKQLLEYDDVANDQRKRVYEQRNELMEAADISETIHTLRRDVVNGFIDVYIPPQSLDETVGHSRAGKGAGARVRAAPPRRRSGWPDDSLHEETLRERILGELERAYAPKEQLVRREGHAQVREGSHAAGAGQQLEGPPGHHGPSAPGHPPARLTRRKIPSRNTSARPSNCSAPCSNASNRRWLRSCPASRCAPRRTCRQSRSSAAPHARMQFQHAEASALASAGGDAGGAATASDPVEPAAATLRAPGAQGRAQ
jgi:hypothetical protein